MKMIHRYLYSVTIGRNTLINGKYSARRGFTAIFIDTEMMTIELGPKIRDILLDYVRFKQPMVLGIGNKHEGLKMRFPSEKNAQSFTHQHLNNARHVIPDINRKKPRLFKNVIGSPIIVTEDTILYITLEQYISIKDTYSRQYSIINATPYNNSTYLASIWSDLMPIFLHKGFIIADDSSSTNTSMIMKDTTILCNLNKDTIRNNILNMMRVLYTGIDKRYKDQIYPKLYLSYGINKQDIDMYEDYDSVSSIMNKRLYPYKISIPTHDIILDRDTSISFIRRVVIPLIGMNYTDMRVICI